MAAVSAMFAIIGVAGALQNGAYDDFVARQGQPWDIAARALGFDIAAVSISGRERLGEKDVLAAAGVGPGHTLPFLSASDVRDRLLTTPIIKSARVMKLYPNRLVIEIEERHPAGLWQREGNVSVVSEDGVPLTDLRDKSFLGLPFVVGDGAQKRLPEYIGLMKSAGDVSKRVKAGVLVAGRRWDLEMTNGVTVRLPEENPGAAIDALVRLQKEARVLDRDIMSIDLRARDRVAFRLTEEGVAARDASTHKPRRSGG
jgi:cell division protein FtsQ